MYAFHATIEKASFDDAVTRVVDALKDEGFGVLSDLDLQATMKQKLDIDMRPYRLLGACKADLAYQALKAEADIGLLLPCNVAVREESPGKVSVAVFDPKAMRALTNNPQVRAVADEASARLLAVCNRLASQEKGGAPP